MIPLAGLLLASLTQLPDLDGQRLNTPMIAAGDVDSFQTTRDQRWLVYLADAHVNGRTELFRVPLDRPGSARLTSVPGGASVHGRVLLTPDSRSVIFIEGQRKIYRATLEQGTLTLLADFGTNGIQDQFLSPDGTHLAFLATSGSSTEVYGVPLDGHAPHVSLSGAMVAGGNAGRVLHAGTFVLYSADQVEDGKVHAYSVRADGSAAPLQLTPPTAPGGGVTSLALASNGRVVVHGGFPSPTKLQLWSAPIDGSSPAVLISSGHVDHFVTVGQRVVFLAGASASAGLELFSTALDGSTPPVNLYAEPRLQSNDLVVTDTHAVFKVAWNLPELELGDELVAVRLDGSGLTTLAYTTHEGGIPQLTVTPDGQFVLFRRYADLSAKIELWSSSLATLSAPVRLNGPMVAGGGVGFLTPNELTRDGRVLYRADEEVDGRTELYLVPVDGSAPRIKLNPPLPAGGFVTAATLDPGQTRAVFGATLLAGRIELVSATLEALPEIDLESGPTVPEGDVLGYLVPAPNRILYVADALVDGQLELFQSRFHRPLWRP